METEIKQEQETENISKLTTNFKIRFNGVTLKNFIESIKTISSLTKEINIDLTEKGLNIIGMCPANISMFDLSLNSYAFSNWDIKEKETIGVNVTELKNVFKNINPKKAIVEITKENDYLMIKEITETEITYKIPLIEVDNQPNKPEFTTAITIITEHKPLKELMKKVKSFESLRIETEVDKTLLNCKNDLTEINTELKGVITADKDYSVKSKYNIEYLTKVLNFKGCENITLKYDIDYPLIVKYDFKDIGYLEFIIAPRIEND